MRQFIRHPTEMPIRYHQDSGETRHEHTLRDFSTGGLSFHTHEALQPGHNVHIEIQIRPPPFMADGTVVWCRKDGDGYQVGLQFDDADVVYNLRMIEQLCHIEQYRNDIFRNEGRDLNSEQAAAEWISRYAADFPA